MTIQFLINIVTCIYIEYRQINYKFCNTAKTFLYSRKGVSFFAVNISEYF